MLKNRSRLFPLNWIYLLIKIKKANDCSKNSIEGTADSL